MPLRLRVTSSSAITAASFPTATAGVPVRVAEAVRRPDSAIRQCGVRRDLGGRHECAPPECLAVPNVTALLLRLLGLQLRDSGGSTLERLFGSLLAQQLEPEGARRCRRFGARGMV